jgi:hypothetical protein
METSRRMRWTVHVAQMGQKKNVYRILVGKPEGKGPLGRPRRRWVYNINMKFREIEWDRMVWIDLAKEGDQWRALLNTAINLRVPKMLGNSLSSCTIGGFSRRALLHD